VNQLRINSAANVAGRVVTAILWVVATPFVFHRMGAERFGIWSLFFTFNAYLISLDLGVGRTMLRYIATQRPTGSRRALARTIRWGFWAAIGLGLIWGLGLELSRFWIAKGFHVPVSLLHETYDALLVFAVGVVILFPAQALTASLQGFERIDLSNVCVVSGVLAHVLLLCVAVSTGWGLPGAALAGVASQLVSGVMAFIFLRRCTRAAPEEGLAHGPHWREMVQFSAALQLLGMLIVLQIQSGRLVLGLLGNLKMVADYELSFRVASGLAGIPLFLRDPYIPAVSRQWDGKDPETVRPMLTSSSWWVYMSSALMLGLLWLTADDLTRVWLGPGHEGIATLMRWWVLVYVGNLAYAPGVAIARGMGIPKYEIVSYAAALVTSVGLAVLWVPRYATTGAVAAVAISYVVGTIVFCIPFHRPGWHFPFRQWFLRDFVPPVLAGWLATLTCGALFAAPFIAGHLPPVGFVRGSLIGLVFLGVLGLYILVARTLALRRPLASS